MRCIDTIAAEMTPALEASPSFRGVATLVYDLATAAKVYSETMRADADVFDVWADFASGAEKLLAVRPKADSPVPPEVVDQGLRLIRDGTDLLSSISRARVPMPKSTAVLIERSRNYRKLCALGVQSRAANRPSNGHRRRNLRLA
jgi:hypothetical protein